MARNDIDRTPPPDRTDLAGRATTAADVVVDSPRRRVHSPIDVATAILVVMGLTACGSGGSDLAREAPPTPSEVATLATPDAAAVDEVVLHVADRDVPVVAGAADVRPDLYGGVLTYAETADCLPSDARFQAAGWQFQEETSGEVDGRTAVSRTYASQSTYSDFVLEFRVTAATPPDTGCEVQITLSG